MSSNNIKENVCIGIAKGHALHEEEEKALSYYLKAMAFRMGAVDYEGEHVGNFMQSLKAHGKGKITYKGGLQYTGNFIDGKIQESGEIEIQYPDKSVYKGAWKKKITEGLGVITYANGISLESEFKNSLPVGKSKITNPVVFSSKGDTLFDLNDLDKFLLDTANTYKT